MKKIFYLATAAVLALSSCHKDSEKEDDIVTPDAPAGKGDVTEKLDNASAQKKLESYATEFIDKFKPEDQQSAINALNSIANIFDEIESPDQWSKDDNKPAKKCFVAQYAKNLATALSKKDYSKSTTINEEFIFDFAEYAGIFTYKEGAEDWEYAPSNDIVFKYKCDGTDCEFKAVRASGNISEQFDNGEEIYKISCPAGVVITLNYGGQEIMKADVNLKYESSKSLQAVASCTIANLKVTSTTSITNNKISDNQTIAIDGTTLLWTEFAVDGNHFTDIKHFEEKVAESNSEEYEEEEDEINLRDYITSTSGKVNIMGNVQISYEAKLDSYFDNLDAFDYDSEDKQSVQEYCDAWNKSYNIKFFYSGTDVEQGNLKMQPVLEDSWETFNGRTYEEWGVQPVIVFGADGTSFAFEDYFNQDKFASTDSQLESLLDKYEEYWD